MIAGHHQRRRRRYCCSLVCLCQGCSQLQLFKLCLDQRSRLPAYASLHCTAQQTAAPCPLHCLLCTTLCPRSTAGLLCHWQTTAALLLPLVPPHSSTKPGTALRLQHLTACCTLCLNSSTCCSTCSSVAATLSAAGYPYSSSHASCMLLASLPCAEERQLPLAAISCA